MDKLVYLYSTVNNTLIHKSGEKFFSIPGSSIIVDAVAEHMKSYVEGCIPPNALPMVGYTETVGLDDKKAVADSTYSGLYTLADVKEKEESSDIQLIEHHNTLLAADSNDSKIQNIKTAYSQCSKDYFYIPLRLITTKDILLPDDVKLLGHHANGILIKRSKETFIRIEPDFGNTIITKDIEDNIDAGVKRFLLEIGLRNPVQIPIHEICPQSLTKDGNCAFWAMYIFKTIIENKFMKDPNEIIKEISSRTDLPSLINNFKTELMNTIIPDHLKAYGLRWPAYEKMLTMGGKNGNHKYKFRKTKRKNGFSLRKTGKSKGRK